ncbi:MAG: hypothetical protein WKF90_09830 [Pyrinomonadaceae bacterium]
MTSEFDKEIDALLRQTAKGETASAAVNSNSTIENPQSFHLDADEISAFAENALPENIKQKYTIHLADCNRCRSTLSNLIALNAETKIEILHAEKTEKVRVVTPWYRKLFASPNLAFTMGALLLAFSGLIAYVVLQNNNTSPGLEISQISEQTEKAQGPSFNEVLPAQESFSNSMTSNSASTVSATNSTSTLPEKKATNPSTANSNMSAAAKQKVIEDEAPRAELNTNNFALAPNRSNLQPEVANTNTTAIEKEELRKAENKNDKAVTLESTDAIKPAPNQYNNQLPLSGRNASSLTLTKSRKNARETSETTAVGKKTFRRANDVWIDSTYKGQSTTSISRGTNEYKNLDFGLRSIVENLGGTVIVVWKEKVYRVQ